MSSVAISETNCQSLDIVYKDQDTNLDLEKISYYKTLNHLNFADADDALLKDYWNNLDLILCEINVDLSTLGLLCDSANEKAGKLVGRSLDRSNSHNDLLSNVFLANTV